ncbi:hypothetical protein D9756_005910 [Leucocoprinus leucothites]|uniref:Uncharacterized protein n=1 Tax=Leucocoprinus leucothites TaxID=201217 RepID=A0A8H5FWX0_9AGAR|nr:hypothetical protein D9756_005910 [Leucoagaricus leucothites]
MSLWKIGADDISEETQQFKDKLASKDGEIAGQQAKLMKQTLELEDLKANLTEALQKLAVESERALNLQEDLTRCNEDRREEKNNSRNLEASLQAANGKLKAQDNEVRDLEAALDRLSSASDGHHARSRKLEQEKSALESRVRELESNIRQLQSANVVASRRPPSRSSSSGFNDLRIKNLERDLGDLRDQLLAREREMGILQEKLTQAQGDLLRSDNERLAREAKYKVRIDGLQSLLEERDEELEFYRERGGDGGREAELMQRIEEDEAKIIALEATIRQSDDVKGLKERLRCTEQRLRAETESMEHLKTRNVDLEQERESALSELQGCQGRVQELEQLLREKLNQVDSLEEERTRLASVADEVKAAPDSVDAPPVAAVDEVDVLHVARLLNAIERLREERDGLRRNLQFLETEHRFTVEALEKRLVSDTLPVNRIQPQSSQSLGCIVPALAILLSRSQTRLEHCQRWLTESTEREQHYSRHAQANLEKYVALEEESDQNVCQLKESEEKREELEARLETITGQHDDLVSQLEAQKEEMKSSHKVLQDHLEEVEVNLTEVSRSLEVVESERDSLALQVTNLTADLQAAQDELASAEERYSALQLQQLSSMSSSDATRALREQMTELEARVARRTEQIGIHQHDIRRLETNLKLQEERLGEMTMELETLATQKEAMLEDCADAREARDEALSRIEMLEEELEILESKLADSDQALDTLICLLVQTKSHAQSSAQRLQLHASHLEDQLKESQETNAALGVDLFKSRTSSSQDLQQATIAFATSQLELMRINTCARSLMAKKAELERNLIAANKQISQERTTNRRLEQKCTTLRRGSSSSVVELATRSAEYQAEIDKLMKIVSEVTAESEFAQKQLAHSAAELERRQQEREDLVMEHQEAKSRLIGMHEAEMEGLQKELSTTVTMLDAERANRTVSEQEREGELSHARLQINGLENRVSALSEELLRLVAAQQDLVEEKVNAQKESDSLRTEFDLLLQERENQKKVEEDLRDANRLLSEQISCLQEERESLMEGHMAHIDQHQKKLETLNLRLESQVAELTRSVEDQAEEIQHLSRELDTTTKCLKEKEYQSAAEMQALSDENGAARARISLLEQEIEVINNEIESTQVTLSKEEEEKERLQEHITGLEAQIQKSLSYTNALERQIRDGESSLETLKKKLSSAQAELSRAETTAKTSEVNLSLQSAQFKRELAKLQDKLVALESKRNLEDALSELEERNNEMEELLRTKCAEIEENDDRALEMLKENKKLSGKVEALTRKVQNLQTKLTAAKAAVVSSKAPTEAAPTVVKSPQEQSPQSLPRTTETQAQTTRRRSSRSSTGTAISTSADKPPSTSVTRASVSRNASRPPPATLRPKTPERRLAPTPVFKPRTPEQSRAQERTSEPPSSVAGVKRRAPDDFEASEAVPPQGFTIDSLPSRENDSTTPRVRKIFGNLQSGFTPIRNKALSSPQRQSTVLSTPLIQDVTNSPRNSVPLDSAAKQKRSWLGKIRGTSSQATVKPASRQVFTYVGETQRR